ncbi:MAG: hypothetical protein ACPLRY_06610 [Candidatus Bathyarchaeales archaeon]
MQVPKVEERQIISTVKNRRYLQHSLTLPKKFADSLKAEGVKSLYIMYGSKVLIAFPETVKQDELIALLKLNIELEKLLSKEA